MAGSVIMNQTDFSDMGRIIPKIVEDQIIDPIMKRGTKPDFGRTGDHRHTETEQKPIPEETETSAENPEQQEQMAMRSARSAFAPRQATPAVQIFTPLPSLPLGGFRLDDGSKTQNFIGLVARSNAGYLRWQNRFSAIPAGSIPAGSIPQ